MMATTGSPRAGDEHRARGPGPRSPDNSPDLVGGLVRATSVGPGARGLAAPTTAPTWWPSVEAVIKGVLVDPMHSNGTPAR